MENSSFLNRESITTRFERFLLGSERIGWLSNDVHETCDFHMLRFHFYNNQTKRLTASRQFYYIISIFQLEIKILDGVNQEIRILLLNSKSHQSGICFIIYVWRCLIRKSSSSVGRKSRFFYWNRTVPFMQSGPSPTSHCKINGHFSIETHHFSWAILHSFCIFIRKSERIGIYIAPFVVPGPCATHTGLPPETVSECESLRAGYRANSLTLGLVLT